MLAIGIGAHTISDPGKTRKPLNDSARALRVLKRLAQVGGNAPG
jgi:hypothetical protein